MDDGATASVLGVDEVRGMRENVRVAEAGTVEPVGSSNNGPALVSSGEAVTAGPPKLAPNGLKVLLAATLTMSGNRSAVKERAGKSEHSPDADV